MRKENRGTTYAADRIAKESVRSCRGGQIRQRNAERQAMGVASICITSCGLLGLDSRENVSSVRVALRRKQVRPRNGRMLSCACICPGLKVSHGWDNMWCIRFFVERESDVFRGFCAFCSCRLSTGGGYL